MAIYLTAKAPESTYRYTWAVPIAEGDSVLTAVATVSTGTAVIEAQEVADGALVMVLSGGAAGEVTVITVEADTNDGEVLTDTLYLPILTSANALGNTGSDIASYILRKVAGIGDVATGDELNDCLERLSGMLASWKLQGADLGIALPVTSSTEFLCEDGFIQAIRANGILAIADLYENYNPSPIVVEQARRGLQQIKASLLSTDERPAVYY